MPRASNRARLMELHAQLQQALEADNWGEVAAVDNHIRQCLEDLARQPSLDEPTIAAKARLQQLHSEGLNACVDECERLRLLLLNHLEYAEGRAAYQRVDMYQAGDRG